MPQEDVGQGEWVAMYMPDTSGEDPSKAFETEGAAWEYVFGRMCAHCRRERAVALGAEPTPEEARVFAEIAADEYPACAAEWCVIPMAEYVELGEAAASSA